MFEMTTEPLTLDIWRGLCPASYGDVTAWAVDFDTGRDDACNVTPSGEVMTLLHGRAKLEDVRDIDVITGWCDVDPVKVEHVEAIRFDDATMFRMVDQLQAATERLRELEDVDEDD